MVIMEEFLIFTDGGAFDKGGYNFRAVDNFRFFKVTDRELIHKEICITEEGTSPFAEINAIARALENAYEYVKAAKLKEYDIKLYTDSMLCYNSLTMWIYSWMKKAKKTKGVFMSSSGQPVLNQEQIKKAFYYLTELRKKGTVTLFHINSHTAKKNVKKLKEKFEKFNKCKVTDDEFLFIYLQNSICDEEIKKAHDEFIENKKPKNNLIERLKEEI
jgi:ribonuclease HI